MYGLSLLKSDLKACANSRKSNPLYITLDKCK